MDHNLHCSVVGGSYTYEHERRYMQAINIFMFYSSGGETNCLTLTGSCYHLLIYLRKVTSQYFSQCLLFVK